MDGSLVDYPTRAKALEALEEFEKDSDDSCDEPEAMVIEIFGVTDDMDYYFKKDKKGDDDE